MKRISSPFAVQQAALSTEQSPKTGHWIQEYHWCSNWSLTLRVLSNFLMAILRQQVDAGQVIHAQIPEVTRPTLLYPSPCLMTWYRSPIRQTIKKPGISH